MSALGRLVVDLTLRTAEYEAGTEKAVYLTAKAEKDIERAIGRLQTKAVAMGTVLGSYIKMAMDSVVGRFTGAVDALDQINVLQGRSGIAAGTLQELAYAAKLSDTSLESLATGLKKLQVNMGAAAAGSKEQANAFKSLQVEVKNADGSVRAADDVMMQLADLFQALPDDALATALAVKLFGKTGEEMLPFLRQGSEGIKALRGEAREFGLVVGDGAVKAAADFKDNMDRLNAVSAASAQTIAQQVVPWMNRMLEQFIQGQRLAGGFWGAMKLGLTTITSDNAGAKVQELTADVARLQNIMDRSQGGTKFGAYGERFRQQLADAKRELEWAKYLQRQNIDTSGAGMDAKDRRLLGAAGSGAAVLAGEEARRKAMAALRDEKAKGLDLDKQLEAMRAKEQREREQEMETGQRKLASMQQENEKLRESVQELGKTRGEVDRLQAARLEDQAAQKEGIAVSVAAAEGTNYSVVALRREAELLRERARLLRDKGAREDGLQAERDALDRQEAYYKEHMARIKKENDQRDHEMEKVGDTITDALMRGFENGKDFAKNFRDTLKNMFLTLVLRPLIQPAVVQGSEWLFNLLRGQFGGPSYAGTGAESYNAGLDYPIGMRAGGGPIEIGRPYIVGERGPELVVPKASGTVIPNGALGGQSITFAPTINIDGALDQSRTVAMIQDAMRSMARQLGEVQRRQPAGVF